MVLKIETKLLKGETNVRKVKTTSLKGKTTLRKIKTNMKKGETIPLKHKIKWAESETTSLKHETKLLKGETNLLKTETKVWKGETGEGLAGGGRVVLLLAIMLAEGLCAKWIVTLINYKPGHNPISRKITRVKTFVYLCVVCYLKTYIHDIEYW